MVGLDVVVRETAIDSAAPITISSFLADGAPRSVADDVLDDLTHANCRQRMMIR